MGIQEAPFSIRIEKEVMDKLRILAKDNSRSLNKQIEYSLKKYLKAYEEAHGEITVERK
ncbi:MAG: Arc family DNA-binding protein [Clostridiales bacterium]|nr:Arc family DNA-binding protein [Clostridiales bacterium]